MTSGRVMIGSHARGEKTTRPKCAYGKDGPVCIEHMKSIRNGRKAAYCMKDGTCNQQRW